MIVHLYDEIDYEIVRDSIDPALEDFGQLLAARDVLSRVASPGTLHDRNAPFMVAGAPFMTQMQVS